MPPPGSINFAQGPTARTNVIAAAACNVLGPDDLRFVGQFGTRLDRVVSMFTGSGPT